MAHKRPRRGRGLNNSGLRVDVLERKADHWFVVRHVFLTEALKRIALREWTARWYEDGELAGVELMPPPRNPAQLVPIPCGSVECRKGWILNARIRVVVKDAPQVQPDPLRQLLDFFDVDLETKLRRVSAELALKKIALEEWRAIWYEDGELAGVAAA